MARITSRSWSRDEEDRLISFAQSGASIIRAAAALKRTVSAVRARAIVLGISFRTRNEFRKKLKIAAEKFADRI